MIIPNKTLKLIKRMESYSNNLKMSERELRLWIDKKNIKNIDDEVNNLILSGSATALLQKLATLETKEPKFYEIKEQPKKVETKLEPKKEK